MKNEADPEIENQLEQLRAAILAVVRREQRVDRLTGLANDEALNEWIAERIEDEDPFWLAFVEVDHFKAINQKYEYENADRMLERVAAQLRNAAENFFSPSATPFRAHGDEFFLGGSWDKARDAEEKHVLEGLDHLRSAIAAHRVEARDAAGSNSGTMRCTVSIGWATSSDATLPEEPLKRQRLRACLEDAVAEAKWRRRNNVVRYEPSMSKRSGLDGRSDCDSCGTWFTVIIPSNHKEQGDLHCPNCGRSVTRPDPLRAHQPTNKAD
jgi:diguanylate cyclase (GGDEF)-like protein